VYLDGLKYIPGDSFLVGDGEEEEEEEEDEEEEEEEEGEKGKSSSTDSYSLLHSSDPNPRGRGRGSNEEYAALQRGPSFYEQAGVGGKYGGSSSKHGKLSKYSRSRSGSHPHWSVAGAVGGHYEGNPYKGGRGAGADETTPLSPRGQYATLQPADNNNTYEGTYNDDTGDGAEGDGWESYLELADAHGLPLTPHHVRIYMFMYVFMYMPLCLPLSLTLTISLPYAQVLSPHFIDFFTSKAALLLLRCVSLPLPLPFSLSLSASLTLSLTFSSPILLWSPQLVAGVHVLALPARGRGVPVCSPRRHSQQQQQQQQQQ
jgi:hypothetical protein